MKSIARHFFLFIVLVVLSVSHAFAQLVFVRGSDNALWLREGTAWKSLGGHVTSAPDACSWGRDRVDVFVRDASNGLAQIARVGGQWTQWFNLGGSLSGGPAAVSWGPDRIDVFAVGTDRTMQHKSWDGTRWTEWVSLGGEFPAGSSPDATSRGPNRLDVFARGSDNALWHNAWENGQWNGWNSLGGEITSDPAAVAWDSSRLDIFARNTDGQMVQIAWDGANWTDWFQHGGSFAPGSGPDVSSLGTNRLEVYGRGADNSLVRKAWNGSQWSDWVSLGGVLTSDPGAIAVRGAGVRFLAEVEDIVRSYSAHQGGATSVGIVDRSGRTWFLNYGHIEPGVRASEDSVYSIGSVSKVLTGTLVKMINEEQRVVLDQPAQQYLPREIQLPVWYPDPFNTGVRTHITVRHILTHRSGLPRNFSETEPLDMRLPNFVRLFSTVSLQRAPGSDPVEYSNIGSELMTALVEKMDNRSYAESLRARLTGPLGMTSTGPNRIAHPRLPPHKIGYPEGGGYVQSTTRDMVKFMRAASRWDVNEISGPILRAQIEGLFWFGNILTGAFHHNGKNPAADSATWGLQQSGIMADPTSERGVVVLTQKLSDDDMRALRIARDIILLARARTGNDVFNW